MKHLASFFIVFSLIASTGLLATDIGGTATSDVTLTSADSPYDLTSDYIIPDGFTLTIEPGVQINFNSYTRDILVAGTLIANGTALDSITFISATANGGGSVVLQSSSNSHSMMYCSFENLGFFSLSSHDTGLYLEDTDLTMDHCSFINCGPGGTRHMTANASVLSNIGSNNSLEMVLLLPATLDRTCTWPKMDTNGVTYRITEDQICPLGETLTIEGGVEIDLYNYYTDLQISGELVAIGSSTDSINFVSSGPNNGGSVALLNGSLAEIRYTHFLDLGTFSLSAYDTGLYVEESDLTMDRCSFSNCGPGGVRSITADASAVSNIGSNNDLDRIRLLSLTLDKTSTWPKVDQSGVTYELPGDQNVLVGDSLIIDAGVQIELLDYFVDIVVQGAIKATGSEVDPIRIFCSSSNGGGSLVLDSASVGELEYMNLDSLGTFSLSTYDTGLEIRDASVTADHLNFTFCGPSGSRHIKSSPDAFGGFGPDNSVEDVLFIGATVPQDAVWPLLDPSGVTYLISNDITVDAGIRLTVEPGVEVEMTDYSHDLLIDGTLVAIGTSQDSIRFSGPNSNGGGSIIINASSLENHLKYCSLNRLGSFSLSSKDAGVYTESLDLIIEKSKIRGSRNGVKVEAGQPSIKNNIIKDNSILGLSNSASNGIVNACDNYWGDPSGPFNATSNPTGTGNGVSNNVLAGECFLGPLEVVCPADVMVNVGEDYSLGAIGDLEICIQDCAVLASNSFADDILDPQCTEDMLRTFSVTDTCGASASCVQTVSFVDGINPTISCPPNEVLDCNESLPAVDLGQVVATDNCEVASVILANQQESVEGCIHTYSRRFRATDTSGNTARCTQTFTVKEDLVAPVLVGVPADVTVQCEAPAVASVTATDDCDDVTVTFTETGSAGCGNTIIRTWSATDACGNNTTATQTITFNDTTAPVLNGVPSDVAVECEAPAVATVTATDNCDDVTVIFSETGTPGCGNTIVRTWSSTDACGNNTTATQTITFNDTTAPVLDPVPADLVVSCASEIPPAATLSATDNCGSATVVFGETGTPSCSGTISRTWTATDDCGNSTVASQTITFDDTTAPVLDPAPADLEVSCASEIPPAATLSATDNCGAATVVFGETGTPTCSGTIIRTWTATDDCGNSTVASQTITFDDTTAPELDPAPADIEITCTDPVPSAATLNATDNCGSASVVFNEEVIGICPGMITRTWTATDDCGNSSLETQIITISLESACDLNNICTDMDVTELGFGTANARVNATWNNPNGTADCEVRGGRIAPASIGTGNPQFANINNTRIITQTDGSTVLFNIVLFNNPNVPFIIGQTYGYEVRCLCEDETEYTNWSGLTPAATFVVPSPPAAIQAEMNDEAKFNDETKVSVFPNPSNGEEINLSISGTELENAFIRIMDMNGKLIPESRLDRDVKSGIMNLKFESSLEQGVYMIQVFNETQMINQRFIVE